ncbi:MAG: enoyl-CoA hydratase, partial [Actinomycetota bacterium]|nr:enoyl-CoA hydratase [Actinomycetota bacterium]
KVVLYSDVLGTFGNHSFCRGTYTVKTTAPKGKRGVVRLTLVSHGFTGDGPTWKRNPKCRFVFATSVTRGSYIPPKQVSFPVLFGPRPGERLVKDIRTGSGLVLLGMTTFSENRQPSQGYGNGTFVLVP